MYDADPAQDAGARRYDEITARTLARTAVGLGLDAGTSAPVDLLASMILGRAGIDAVVIDGSDPERIGRAVRGETVEGTRIVPDGEGEDRLEEEAEQRGR